MFSLLLLNCSADEIADITTPTNHIPHGISTQGGKITSVTTPVSFSKTTSKNAESSTLISATSTLTSDGPTISHITSSTTHLASTTILSSTKPTDENDNKGMGSELDFLFILIVLPILFIACVIGLRLRRIRKRRINNQSPEMEEMDEIEETVFDRNQYNCMSN